MTPHFAHALHTPRSLLAGAVAQHRQVRHHTDFIIAESALAGNRLGVYTASVFVNVNT